MELNGDHVLVDVSFEEEGLKINELVIQWSPDSGFPSPSSYIVRLPNLNGEDDWQLKLPLQLLPVGKRIYFRLATVNLDGVHIFSKSPFKASTPEYLDIGLPENSQAYAVAVGIKLSQTFVGHFDDPSSFTSMLKEEIASNVHISSDRIVQMKVFEETNVLLLHILPPHSSEEINAVSAALSLKKVVKEKAKQSGSSVWSYVEDEVEFEVQHKCDDGSFHSVCESTPKEESSITQFLQQNWIIIAAGVVGLIVFSLIVRHFLKRRQQYERLHGSGGERMEWETYSEADSDAMYQL